MSKQKAIVCAWAWLACALPAVALAQGRDTVRVARVDTDTLMKHVRVLSSVQCEGRLAGTVGYDRAMAYVKQALSAYGVEEIGEQPMEVECNEVESCTFDVYLPGSKEKTVYTLGREFCCAGMTGRGYVDAQMVFCGYGIDHSTMDEYRDVDVQGKVVVVLTGLPVLSALPGQVASQYQSLRDKARTAERHGAIGLIAINTSRLCPSGEPQSRVYCGGLPHLATFPMLQLTLDCARELLADEARPLDSLLARENETWTPRSFALRKKAEIDLNARYRPQAATANIVGLLPGSDRKLAKEYVVVGASLDGAGMQGATCLFPGADINATGVAALLETARLLSHSELRPGRSVLFVVFSGSEQQYLGSRVFMNTYGHLRRVEAFVNVQNVGYGDSLVVLGGNHYPTLYDIARRYDAMPCCGTRMMAAADAQAGVRGDARAFDAAGIPSLVITTRNGMHHNHVGSDIWETIDRRVLTGAAQLLVGTVAGIGQGDYQGRSMKSRAGRY
ncbi:MAG: M28 family peptidase [Bacteroidales bacterium]|nr:M28 family peptidase [Bacteroidales bacterium]